MTDMSMAGREAEREAFADEVNKAVAREERAKADMAKAEAAAERVFAAQIAQIEEDRETVQVDTGLAPTEQLNILRKAQPVVVDSVNYAVAPEVMARITDSDIIRRAIASADRDGAQDFANAWRVHQTEVAIDVQDSLAIEAHNQSTVDAMNAAKAAADAQMNAAVTAANQPPKTDADWARENARLAAQTEAQMRGM